MSEAGNFFSSLGNSSFPNLSETYKCKFSHFGKLKIADGREFNLLILDATDSQDRMQKLSTIVEKVAAPPAELLEEIFEVITEKRDDSKYPRIMYR